MPNSAAPTGARPRPLLARWRPLLVGLLALGLVGIALRFPATPRETWPDPRLFFPGDAECRALRESREWTRFETPQTAAVITVGEVARKHNLDTYYSGVEPVCRANDWEPDCVDIPLTPGERVVLPLHQRAVEAARQARLGQLGEGDGGAAP